jgi:hypothetical protein
MKLKNLSLLAVVALVAVLAWFFLPPLITVAAKIHVSAHLGQIGAMLPFCAAGILSGPITLLDLAARSGDNVQSVVEDVTTHAPEWGIIPAVARQGISYDVLRRTGALPGGGFRQVGGGVKMQKSGFERETKPMFLFEALMSIGEDVVMAQTAQSRATMGDVLSDEAMATVRGSAINFGAQTWYGIKADAAGFAGMATQVATVTNADLDAGGGGAGNTTSAYLLWLDPDENNPQGVHFSVGQNGGFNFGEWLKMKVDKGGGKAAMEWVNNFLFYVGLSAASDKSVFRVQKIRDVDGGRLTDALGAKLVSSVPIGRRQNLRWFMNRTAAYSLQYSRSGVTFNQGAGNGGSNSFPPLPTELQGFPITVTDSLVDTETAGTI